MSLYNNIAESLSSSGLVGSIRSGLDSALGGVAGSASKALGGSKLAQTVTNMGKSMASNAAMNLVNKYVPLKAQHAINAGAGAVGDLMRGDWDSAGMRIPRIRGDEPSWG